MDLAGTPRLLERVELPASLWRVRSGEFALVEHFWHLADLEAEFGARIGRLLEEDAPFLPDFDGGRIARERDYLSRDAAEGLRAFAAARAANLARLSGVTEWSRAGTQEGVGRVSLLDMPRLMLAHDLSHLNEISDLLADLAPGHAMIGSLRSAGPSSSHAA
jgi:hypothetical protein